MKRRALLAAAAVPATAAGLLGAACAIYPPRYVYRVLAWRDADADDYTRFPDRRMASRAGAAPLPRDPQPRAVLDAFRFAGGETDMPRQLAGWGTQAFMVLRNGRVLYEGYFNGAARANWVTSFSVAKSFVSALVGMARAEGAIASLDDPVTRYLPELLRRDERFARITLTHLLRMCSGIRYSEFPFLHGDDAKTYYDPDLRRLALQDTRIASAPGLAFHYNNYNPLILGVVLERATRMTVAAYMERVLWQPCGMSGDASWSLDSDDSGFEKMESGLNARAEDFARFGLLILNEGRVDGRQVVPRDWAVAATSPDEVPPPAQYYAGSPWTAAHPARYYKAFWWGQQRPDGAYDFAARGNHGQLIFVSPRNDVVITRNGWKYGIDSGRWFDMARRMANSLGGATAVARA